MKKILSLITVMVLVLAGCGSTDSNSGEDTKAIGFVTDTGGINDKSFNQGTWEGIESYAKENGIETSYVESKEASQYEANLTAEAQKSDVVVAAGYTFAGDVYNVAKANPDTDFVLIDAEPTNASDEVEELDNVHSYLFNEQEAGFLAGYVAGKQTKTNKVGFIGGIQSPPVQRFGYGFVEGVQTANDKAEVEYNYAGTFDDVSKGKTTATTMFSNGADIIFGAAGGVNAGIVEATKDQIAKGNEVWMIGVDRDAYEDGIYEDGKSLMLTSAMKNVGNAAVEGLKAHYDGSFAAGKTVLGYDEGGVGLPEKNPNLDDALVKEAQDALTKAGDIVATKEDLDKVLTIKVNGEY